MAQNFSEITTAPHPHCLANRHYVTIIKVIDPARFLVRETPCPEMSKSARDFLDLEDQILSRADEFDIIPQNFLIPAKGTYVLVKPTRGKIWYRGRVETILETSKGANINVYLLDYGITDTVSLKAIRITGDKVFEVPFQAFQFVLFALKPLSLQYDEDIKLKRMPAKNWDKAALDFVHNFLLGSTTARIQVNLRDENGRFHGNMFSGKDDELCLNDELVDKSFAWFDEEILKNVNQNFESGETPDLVTKWLLNIPKSGEPKFCRKSVSLEPRVKVQSSKVMNYMPVGPEESSTPVYHQSIGRGKILKKLSTLSLSEESLTRVDGKRNLQSKHTLKESPKELVSMEDKMMPGTLEDRNVTAKGKADGSVCNKSSHYLKASFGSPFQNTSFVVSNPGFGRGGVLRYFAPVILTRDDCLQADTGVVSKSSTKQAFDDQENLNDKAESRNSKETRNLLDPNCDNATQISNLVTSDKDTRPLSRSSSSSHTFPIEQCVELSKQTKKVNQKTESSPKIPCRQSINNSTNWLRYDKYTCLKEKCDKDCENSKICGDLDSSILKPLPPNFTHRVLADSFVNKDHEKKNIDISKEIEQSGVQSFFRKNKEFSSDNTYNTEASLDSTMDYVKHSNEKGKPAISVISHGISIPKPIFKIEEYIFEDPIVRALKNVNIQIPTILQSHLWPPVLRGRCCVAIGLKNSGKSLGYIIPILNQLGQMENYADLPDGPGPLVIVLCTNWMSCQKVQKQFETFGTFKQQNYLTTLHGGDKIQDKMVDLLKGYNILITTPAMLVKVMSNDNGLHIIDRCCHLILEEADHVIEIFVKDLLEIIREFRRAIVRRGKESTTANQIIVCASSWSRGVKSFAKMMPSPLFYFSNFLEAAIHAEIPFHVQITDLHKENTAIFDILQMAPTCNIVICATDYQKVQNLGKLLKLNSYECLMAHEKMVIYEMEDIKHQWNTSASSLNNPIIIVSDAILPLLNITNAECLVHYNLPDLSKLQFSNRFSCLQDGIKYRGSVVEDIETMAKKTSLKECVSHVIINDTHSHQCYELKRIMMKLKSTVSPQMASLAKAELLTRELCPNLLAFGACDVKEFCRLRHKFFTEIDQPPPGFPHFGEIKILVKYVVNASLFYANILSYQDSETGEVVTQCRDEYTNLDLELQDYYQNCKIKEIVSDPIVGDLCAMRGVGGTFYRVKIIKVYPVDKGQVQKLKVFSIDAGWFRSAELSTVFQLPNNFASLPPQAVKIRICKVKPIDGSNLWTVQANTFVSDALIDHPVIGKVVISLRDCIFVTNLGRRRNLNNPDDILVDTSVVSKLKSENLAIANLRHIELLQKLCNKVISWKKGPIEVKKIPLSTLVTEEYFEVNSSNEVYVTTVRSPSLFYVVPTKTYEKLNELNDFINKLYQEEKLNKATMVKKNNIVIAPFEADQRWYRARIMEIQEQYVQLYFPDFGDDGVSALDDVYEMPSEIVINLPFQALECSLASIKSAHGGWSELAIDAFVDLTREDDDPSVYCKLILKPVHTSTALNIGGSHYHVTLHFENEVSLGSELVKQGLAEHTNRSPLKAITSNDSGDESVYSEDLDKIEKECENNAVLQWFGFEQKSIERFRGYKLHLQSQKTTKDIEIGRDQITNEMAKQPFPRDVVAVSNKKYYPKTTWFQTAEQVVVHIQLSSCSDYSAEISEKFISFQTIHSNKFYDLHEELYDDVDAGTSNIITLPERVKLTLQKCVLGQEWPRLTKLVEKKLYIKLHVDHIHSEDEKLKINNSVSSSVVRNEYVRHYDTDTTSESEEEWVRETEEL